MKKQKKKRIKIKTYACDFETNTENWLHPDSLKDELKVKENDFELWRKREAWKQHVKGDQAFVWSWGSTEIREDMSFIGELDNFTYGKSIQEYVDWMLDGSKNVWFHNLKFDGSFIAVELLRRNFTFNKNPAKGHFTGLINGKKSGFNLKCGSKGVRGGG